MRERIMNVMKKKEDNKGFTLVELIVVIVILAILAAILVPALIGWIDRAKESQYTIEARNIYLATQAVISEEYGKDSSITIGATWASGDILDKIEKLADLSDDEVTIAGLAVDADKKITNMAITFTDDSVTMTLSNNGWTKTP